MQHDQIAPGSLARIRQRVWRIERVRRGNGASRVDVCAADQRGAGGRRSFLAPFDRLQPVAPATRPAVRRRQRAWAAVAGQLSRAGAARIPLAAVRARVDILPHQLEPALAMQHGAARVLIADDVGLGKTVQAALVVAEVMRRDPSARVLVVVPANLVAQWQDELRARFDLECVHADRSSIDLLSSSEMRGADPWRRCGVWLVSLDFIKQPHVMAALPATPWDLVVIDEAHAACGDSARHAAAGAIARASRQVMLLTATPHSGDAGTFARLLSIGQLDDGAPVIFRRTRRVLAMGGPARRARWHRIHLSIAETRLFDALAGYERAVWRSSGRGRRDAARLLLSVLRKRLLSTAAALAISIDRRLTTIGEPESAFWQPALAGLDHGDDDEMAGADMAALAADVGLTADRERNWLRRLADLARLAARDETKIRRLAGLAARAAEPVIVFTEFRDSLEAIASRLRHALPIAVVHGGQPRDVQQQALADFTSGRAHALIATDAAGQGLNLQQRCRWVINFELPWNPVRLEQRAGRVDRLGQRRGVHVTSLLVDHVMDAGALHHLARRVLSAQLAMGGDTLAATVPPEDAVRRQIFDDTPPPTHPAPTAMALCTRWRRPAVHVARHLLRRRMFESRWRADAGAFSRPTRARDAGRHGASTHRRTLLVFGVTLVDQLGAILEERLVPIALAPGETIDDAVVARAGALASASAGRRARRLTRWREGIARGAAAREQAIARGARACALRGDDQAQLIGPRSAAWLDAARARADLRMQAADDRVRALSQSAVSVGVTRLSAILALPR